MAKFAINFVRTHVYDCYYTIEASDEDEAREMAENLARDCWDFQGRIDRNCMDRGVEYEVGEVLPVDDDAEVNEFFYE